MHLMDKSGVLRPVIKILTDYLHDDLAHDEVRQALVAACVRRRVDFTDLDVGAIAAMDTVGAGFKTAQLALNSTLGYGHVFLANCAPRKNLVSVRSQGEKVVLGMTASGVAMLLVNAGHTLAPFHDLAKEGAAVFYQTSVPDSGSQFRSRDFFPDAVAELAAHLAAQSKKFGAGKTEKLLAEKSFDDILGGLSFLGQPLPLGSLHPMPQGVVLYIDNFGNIKLNFRHRRLLKLHPSGTTMVVRLGDAVCDAVLGDSGFSQSEGIIALTEGSSGWPDARGKKECFTEIFLRGGRAENHFRNFHPGDQALGIRKTDLEGVIGVLRGADRAASEGLDLDSLSEAKIIGMLAKAGLIRDGFDTAALQKALKQGTLLSLLQGQA
ncbi:MAG: hypothetical protein V1721_08665 [Pseudomonadota bacterium]